MQATIDHRQILPRLKPELTLLETPSTRSLVPHPVVIDALLFAPAVVGGSPPTEAPS